jgi:anti-anti-sigma factor
LSAVAENTGSGKGAIVSFHTINEKTANGTGILSVVGEIDMATAPEFEQALSSAVRAPIERVVVDLTGCTYLDSAALGVLFRCSEGHQLALVTPDDNLLHVLRIVGLDRLVAVHPSRAAALTPA